MTQTPPGWYPDPTLQQPSPQQPGQPPQQAPGPPRLRYWDGRAWTEHVHTWQHQPGPQYAGAQAAPPGPTTPDGVPLSGWWRRAGAYLIDSALAGVAVSIITLPLQLGMQADGERLMDEYLDSAPDSPEATVDFGAFMSDYLEILQPLLMWSALVSFLVWGLYTSLMLRFKGATVGKMVAGIAVRLRDRPGQLPWSAILLRTLVQFGAGLVAVFSTVLYFAVAWFPLLDVLWAAWDKKRQALHDKAAKTNVVRVR